MASSSIVIKVNFGETLRRFSASINDHKLLLGIVALREKIRSLFNFNSDVDFTLTYVDEDGDAITLADDDDLNDVVRQSLNPLRLFLTLKKGNPSGSNGTSTSLSSPQPQLPFGPFPTVLSEFLKSMPEPLHDQLTKLPHELASKAISPTTVISELAEKLTAAYFNRNSDSMAAPKGEPSTGKVDLETKFSNSKNEEMVEKMPQKPWMLIMSVCLISVQHGVISEYMCWSFSSFINKISLEETILLDST